MSKQKILAISGKKQSGKNTCFNFLLGLEMIKSALVRGNMTVTNEGKLWVTDLWGNEEFKGIFEPDRSTESMERFMSELVYPFIKNYSYADILKQDVCINILGLDSKHCYGTEEEKNSDTHLLWENMPGVITPEQPAQDDVAFPEKVGLIIHEAGPMTGREVMQYVGTEIFRKMYSDVWASSTINRIQSEGSQFAVITDVRFPNEVEAAQRAGGKVVKLTRDVFEGEDQHESEKCLDQDRYDWGNFDYIIDNTNMTIDEQNQALHKALLGCGWVDDFKQHEKASK